MLSDRANQDRAVLKALGETMRKDHYRMTSNVVLSEDKMIKEMYLAYCNSVADENTLIQLQERLAWLEYRLTDG